MGHYSYPTRTELAADKGYSHSVRKPSCSRLPSGTLTFSLFNKMRLNGVLVKDQQGDTLLSAGQVRVNITDWFFFKDKIELKYIGLTDTYLHMRRSDSVWNYQFLADYFGAGPSTGKKTIELQIRDLDISRLHLIKQDGWRGEDMELDLGGLTLDAEQLDLSQKIAVIHLLKFTKPDFAIRSYNGKRPNPAPDSTVIKNDPLHLRWNPAGWNIVVRHAIIERGSFRDDKILDTAVSTVFDSYHMYFSDIQGDFKDVSFVKDSIKANMRLSTREKSGFHGTTTGCQHQILSGRNGVLQFRPAGRQKPYPEFFCHAF